jgi:hypothetical protein
MGYKSWRTLGVFVALSAFTVGCTNGPQKTSNNLTTNPQSKQQSFPLAGQGQDKNAAQNSPFGQQKSPNLPPMQPPANTIGGTGGLQGSQQSGLNAGNLSMPGQQPALEQFNQLPARQSSVVPVQQTSGSGANPLINQGTSIQNQGFASDPRLPAPNIQPGAGFTGGR